MYIGMFKALKYVPTDQAVIFLFKSLVCENYRIKERIFEVLAGCGKMTKEIFQN